MTEAASGQLPAPSRLSAGKLVAIVVASFLLLCIAGAALTGLFSRFSGPESASSMAYKDAPGQVTAPEVAPLLASDVADTAATVHTVDKLKSLVLKNRLAVIGITLTIVAVLVGVIVAAVLLSQSEAVDVVVEPKPDPEIGPVDPQPVHPKEPESGPSLRAWIGIGFAIGLLLLAACGVALYLCNQDKQYQDALGYGEQLTGIMNQSKEGNQTTNSPGAMNQTTNSPGAMNQATNSPGTQFQVKKLPPPQQQVEEPTLKLGDEYRLISDLEDDEVTFKYYQQSQKLWLSIEFPKSLVQGAPNFKFTPAGPNLKPALIDWFASANPICSYPNFSRCNHLIDLEENRLPQKITLHLSTTSSHEADSKTPVKIFNVEFGGNSMYFDGSGEFAPTTPPTQ